MHRHGQLLDEATIQLLAEKDVWLSLQALDEAPPTATASTKAKKHTVVEGTDNAFMWARKYQVKLAWGTDLMFVPAQMKNQNTVSQAVAVDDARGGASSS